MTGNLVAAAPDGAATTALVGSLVYALVGAAVYCWYAAALAALFDKMGAPRWKAWVPVVSQMELLERAGRPAWHVVFVLFVPLYGLWVWALALHQVNQSFGRGTGYTVLGVLMPPVWASMLGWGSDQPDFEPRRMYPTMAPSVGRGPLAAPESVPMWAGAPMGASAPLGAGQPWAPAGAPLTGGPGDFSGFGQPAAAPGSLPPVLQAPVPEQPAMYGQPAMPGRPVVPGEPAMFGQPATPGQPAMFVQPAMYGQPAMPGRPVVSGESAMFGQPAASDQSAFSGRPALPGQPVAPGESAMSGQPAASEQPAMYGQAALPGQPVVPGESAMFGQPMAPGQPWPQEQVPWPQSSEPSTLVDQFLAPGPGPAPYAPQPVDLASFGQPGLTPSAPAPIFQPDSIAPVQPFAAASVPAAPGPGPVQGFPVPDPRFATPAPATGLPVSLAPDPVTPVGVPVSNAGVPSPTGGLIPLPPGAVLPPVAPAAALSVQPAAPFVGASAAGAALAPLPAASLPATSLPAVSAAPAPPPLTLVGSSSDAQQTVVIPLPDDDVEGTVVVRRPTFQPWVLSLDDGRTFIIRSRSVVLGRRPDSVDLGVQVLTVTDDGRTISKTHARLDLVDDVWRVVDLGSTNGVVATDADGEEIDVEPGKATPVYGRLALGAVGMRLTPGGSS